MCQQFEVCDAVCVLPYLDQISSNIKAELRQKVRSFIKADIILTIIENSPAFLESSEWNSCWYWALVDTNRKINYPKQILKLYFE